MSRPLVTSVQELRLLSELCALAGGGLSPTDLAARTKVPRANVYVLLGRLAESALVKKQPAGDDPQAVLYCITPAGRKAREAFAKATGLQT